MRGDLHYDEIGSWTEIKLEILKEYAAAYSAILSKQTKASLFHVYIDAFAGAGQHISKASQETVPGSPLNALAVQNQFREYHLIDTASRKIESLRHLIGPRKEVFIHQGDCNEILLKDIFPRVKYTDYRRGLCVLDPYGIHLTWAVISTAGQMKSLDVFLNFPIHDMNRNVFRRDPQDADESQIQRMNLFWGDDSWKSAVYETRGNLFEFPEKESNESIAEAFRQRLKRVAGFKFVPKPVPMKNSTGAAVFYLFFATHNATADRVVRQIFQKYQLPRST
jgi:three-Cys-motif partner protein